MPQSARRIQAASLGPRSIELAVFGADYPIFDSRVASDALADARITDATRAAIAAGNAARVLGIAGAPIRWAAATRPGPPSAPP